MSQQMEIELAARLAVVEHEVNVLVKACKEKDQVIEKLDNDLIELNGRLQEAERNAMTWKLAGDIERTRARDLAARLDRAGDA